MEPQWWTIVVRAFSHENTESGLIIRLTRSDDDDTEVKVCGSVPQALEQIGAWLIDLSALSAPSDGRLVDHPSQGDEDATRRLRRPDDGSTSAF